MAWPLSDSFTGTNGTDLSVYNASWVGHTSWANSFGIHNNRCASEVTASGTSVVYYNDAAPSANYEVEGTVYQVSTNTSDNIGVVARVNTAQATCYMARYRYNTGVQLFKFVNNTTAVQLGSTVSGNLSNGGTMVLKLTVNGDQISVSKDGSVVIGPITDTDITAAGYAGIWGNGTTTTGAHLDDWSATDLGAGGGGSIAAIAAHYSKLRRT